MDRTSLRRRTVLLAVALLTLSVATGCAARGPVGRVPAAVVDGKVISQARVTDLLQAQRRYYESASDPQAVERLATFLGTGTDTFSLADASVSLESWINFTIAQAHLKRLKRPITDEDRQAAGTEIENSLVSSGITLDSIDAELLSFTIESSATTTVLREMVAKEVAANDKDRDARIKAMFEELAPQRPVCVSRLASASEAEAQAAVTRIEEGEEFAAVVSEVSIDDSTKASGGFIGCAAPEQVSQALTTDIGDPAVGDIIGPIEQEGAWLTYQIVSVTGPTLEQMTPELERQLDAENDQAVTSRLAELVIAADVVVDPRYGTWNAETGTITPPTA